MIDRYKQYHYQAYQARDCQWPYQGQDQVTYFSFKIFAHKSVIHLKWNKYFHQIFNNIPAIIRA